MKLKIFTDGGSRGNPGHAGGGIVVILDNQEIFNASFYFGKKTNNESEYLSFLKSLEWLQNFIESNKVKQVSWFLDSKLVVEQINKNWKIKEERLLNLAVQCWGFLDNFNLEWQIKHIVRNKNQKADFLANMAMDAFQK